jgi:zinc protease
MSLSETLAVRPTPGHPRSYSFPPFERTVMPSGLQVLTVHVPGRPLISANVVIRRGASEEPAEMAGATLLAARAMTEGTARYPGVAVVEAAERLGTTVNVEAGWDSFTAGIEVTAARLRAALELLDEVLRRPSFPAGEVARLRDERLNDLMQLRAEPRRRADWAFAETIYSPESPYARLLGGVETTVTGLGREQLTAVHAALLDPRRAALVVGGDLTGLDVPRLAEEALGDFASGLAGRAGEGSAEPEVPPAVSAVDRRIVRLLDRPGSVQSEIRIGHVGLPRLIPDFHALQVMGAILGGLFNSRLQLNLRESKGYTYGVGAGFDLRRGAGPFSVRTGVQTSVTVPAIAEALKELDRMRGEPVTQAELVAARDYLVGVFPLRFEVPSAVVGALGGLFSYGLPDDELARYRGRVEVVDAAAVRKAAQDHLHTDRLAIVVVGDAAQVAAGLEAAGFGEFELLAEEDA